MPRSQEIEMDRCRQFPDKVLNACGMFGCGIFESRLMCLPLPDESSTHQRWLRSAALGDWRVQAFPSNLCLNVDGYKVELLRFVL